MVNTVVVRAEMSVFVVLSLDPELLFSVTLEWVSGAVGAIQAALAKVAAGDTVVDGLGVPRKLARRQVTISLSLIRRHFNEVNNSAGGLLSG